MAVVVAVAEESLPQAPAGCGAQVNVGLKSHTAANTSPLLSHTPPTSNMDRSVSFLGLLGTELEKEEARKTRNSESNKRARERLRQNPKDAELEVLESTLLEYVQNSATHIVRAPILTPCNTYTYTNSHLHKHTHKTATSAVAKSKPSSDDTGLVKSSRLV